MSQELTDMTTEEVKAFRTGLGLSQEAFGKLCGNISRKGVLRWESEGAPAAYRWVFAAINAGLSPWRTH